MGESAHETKQAVPAKKPSSEHSDVSRPKPGGQRNADDNTRMRVVELALLNAQHALDRGVADAATPNSSKQIGIALGFGWTHVEEARLAFDRGAEMISTHEIRQQMDETSRALAEFMRIAGTRIATKDVWMRDALAESTASLRAHLGLRPEPIAGRHQPALKPDSVYQEPAVEPVLDLIRIEATTALNRLVKFDERDAMLPAAISALGFHLTYAQVLMGDEPGDGRKWQTKVQAASTPIQKLHLWLHKRTNTGVLLAQFASLISPTLDEIRKTSGLDILTAEDTPVLPASETIEQDKEHDALVAAQGFLNTALTTAFAGFKLGADRFLKFADLKSPPKTAWGDELLKGILVSVIGNIAGPGIGMLAAALRAQRVVSRATIDYVAGTTVDSIEAILGKAMDGANKDPNQDARDRQYFYSGLVATQAHLVEQTQNRVIERVRDKLISIEELTGMKAAITDQTTAQLEQMTYANAAHGFAKLRAYQNLGTKDVSEKKPATGKKPTQVADMDDYFARDDRGNPEKEKSTGVGKLTMRIVDHGDELVTHFDRFEVHGMNDDMAVAVFERAGYVLQRLELPLEVEIEPPQWGRKIGTGNPFFAVDDRGTVRASRYWDEMVARLRSPHVRQPSNGNGFISPEAVWAWLRTRVLPKHVARITPGG